MSAPKWTVGMQRIGPGCYVAPDGALHVNAEEICRHLNVPPTPANQQIAEKAAMDALREAYPAASVVRVEDEK